ncbi:MAG: glutathione S-transferase C-terminal domain-containing protein [Solirubrobacteraceae bacterium]
MTTFSLGREGASGRFERQASKFRDEPPAAIVAGRYHLYVCWACPWAHRTVIARELMGLQDAISMSAVDPYRDETGWAFTGGEYTDPVNGFALLSEAYAATDSGFDGRFSVPVLWDKEEGRIVNNESADVLRILVTDFAALAEHPVELVPDALREEIDVLNARIYDDVNNAVYQAGFTTDQAHYEERVRAIFALLDELDDRLAGRRFLFGGEPLETDWRLFTTLVRFDAVYAIHFKCSLRKIAEYPHLWPYLRDLYQWPGVAQTVRFGEIRDHYYRTHPSVNPSGLVALLPREDFDEPPGRERL